MPCYLVERTFPLEADPDLPGPRDSRQIYQAFLENNDRAGVHWICSFVTPNGLKSFCLYAGPTPAAVRRAAELNELPVDRISEVDISLGISGGLCPPNTPRILI